MQLNGPAPVAARDACCAHASAVPRLWFRVARILGEHASCQRPCGIGVSEARALSKLPANVILTRSACCAGAERPGAPSLRNSATGQSEVRKLLACAHAHRATRQLCAAAYHGGGAAHSASGVCTHDATETAHSRSHVCVHAHLTTSSHARRTHDLPAASNEQKLRSDRNFLAWCRTRAPEGAAWRCRGIVAWREQGTICLACLPCITTYSVLYRCGWRVCDVLPRLLYIVNTVICASLPVKWAGRADI